MTKTRPCSRFTRFLLPALLIIGTAGQALAKESDWVTRSNTLAKPALDTVARYAPEFAARIGVEGVDQEIVDIKQKYGGHTFVRVGSVCLCVSSGGVNRRQPAEGRQTTGRRLADGRQTAGVGRRPASAGVKPILFH